MVKMKEVAVVTDSTASIPQELKQEYFIETVPLLLHLDEKTYRDRIDVKTPAELFELVNKASKFPTTSAPPPGEYVEVYRRLGRKVGSIFNLTISSVLSMTFESASQARELSKSELPNIRIEVFDSKSSTGGLGLMALAAARAAASGENMEGVIKAAEEVKSKINHLYVFDTLSYLAKSGRISKAAAMAGNMLSMKPITEMPTSLGRAVVVARPRTKKKALQVLLDMVKARVKPKRPLRVLVEHVCAPDEAERLKQLVLDEFNCTEVLLCEYSPVSSLIVGPGVVGLSCYQE
jgi:DegV family protein with EDD domain